MEPATCNCKEIRLVPDKWRFDSFVICGKEFFRFPSLGGVRRGFLLKFFGMLGKEMSQITTTTQ